jgi:methionyl aminopeptidase
LKRLQIKSDEEIEIMRESCELVSKVHELMAQSLRIGITGIELDKLAEEFIRDHNAKPSFKGYGGFPYTLCISPNYTVVHGFPSTIPFAETDIVSIDCGVYYKGFHGDCAYTYAFGRVAADTLRLMDITKKILASGDKLCKSRSENGRFRK